jgi:hypothetical protein
VRFLKETGMVAEVETGCQLLAQEVEREGGTGGGRTGNGIGDGGLVMMQGPDQGGAGRDGHVRQHFQGAVDPSFEVGLPAAFELQQAVG